MTRRLLAVLLAVTALAGAVQLLTAGPAGATPPGIPSATTARSELGTFTVAAWTHTTTCQRSLFPTWDIISGTCDTRETVLKRDGSRVVTNSGARRRPAPGTASTTEPPGRRRPIWTSTTW